MLDVKWERRTIRALLNNWQFPFEEECALKAKLWELDNFPNPENLESLAIEYVTPGDINE